MNRTVWVWTAALAVTAALRAGVLAAQAPASGATPWLHVRVDEAARSSRVSVNLPMPVVEAALQAAPDALAAGGRIRFGCDRHGLSLADMRKIWRELRNAGDTELISVEEKDETVKVARKGDLVQIRVHKPGDTEEVHVDVPVGLVDALLASEGDTFDVKAVVRELQKPTGVAWVDVREGGREGHRIVIPVPLVVAEAAAAFVPRHAIPLPPEAAKRLPIARAVLQALAEGPDAELVRVEERGEQVIVSKVGGDLHVEVHGRGEEVSVNVPLAAVRDLIREDGTIDPSDVVRLLRHARFSTLVDVHDGDDHVRVTVW